MMQYTTHDQQIKTQKWPKNDPLISSDGVKENREK